MNTKKIKIASLLVFLAVTAFIAILEVKTYRSKVPSNTRDVAEFVTEGVVANEVKPQEIPLIADSSALPPVPVSKALNNTYHIFQTFNNCGPAALSMLLSYYDITVSQKELGEALRPYQNPQGDNDDKSVTLEELGVKAEDYGLVYYHRPGGNMDTLKGFIAQGIPVIARTWLHTGEDIGHFRVIKGYNDQIRQIIQDDSYQGKNLVYSYEEFDELWKAFNYEYLIIVPIDKKEIAEKIIGENLDETVAWGQAAENSEEALKMNPESVYDRFNLSVARYNLGDYSGSVEEYEKVAGRLPFRMLWYQIEPILAYYKLGNYQKVFDMTDAILNNHNRAFSELYQLRGQIFLNQEKPDLAREEFRKTLVYNKNYHLLESERNLLTN